MKRWENILLYCLLIMLPGCNLFHCPDDPDITSTSYIKVWQTDINDNHIWKGYQINGVIGTLTRVANLSNSTWMAIGQEQGTAHIIELTTDGGDNWAKIVDFGDHLPNDPSQFIDIAGDGTPNTAVMIASPTTILRTTNAGAAWTLIPSPTSNFLNAIEIEPGSFGIISGDSVILRSLNGGLSWSATTLPEGHFSYYRRAAIRPPNTAFVVGSDQNQTRVLRTTDRGSTWQLLQTPNMHDATDVAIAGDTVVVINYNQYMRSTDNGDSWQMMPNMPGINGSRRIAYFQGNWVVGVAGDFFLSTDGASTWTIQSDSSTFHHDDLDNLVTIGDLVLYQGLGSGGYQGFAVGY